MVVSWGGFSNSKEETRTNLNGGDLKWIYNFLGAKRVCNPGPTSMAANWKKKKVEIYPGPTSMVVICIIKILKILRESNPGPTSMAAIWKRI